MKTLLGAIIASSVLVSLPLEARTLQDPGDRLRQGWLHHRILGEPQVAGPIYRSIALDASLPVDLRARATIGLGLIEREGKHLQDALTLWKSVSDLPGVSSRWRRTALALIAATPEITREEGSEFLLENLKGKIYLLESDLERVRDRADERQRDLERTEEMLRRLKEEVVSREAFSEKIPSSLDEFGGRARNWLEALLEEERDRERVVRYLVARHLRHGREHFSRGRFQEALDEGQGALEIDPLCREAIELTQRCRQLLALPDGSDVDGIAAALLSAGALQSQAEMEHRALLTEARKLVGEGRTAEAIINLRKLLDEVAWSPVPLSEEHLQSIVEPANQLLERCFSEDGEGGEAAHLSGREAQLVEGLRRSSERLLAIETAIEMARSRAEILSDSDPERGLLTALGEIDRLMLKGRESLGQGRKPEAATAWRDVLTLLEWFPDIDRGGELARELKIQLFLIESGESGDLLTPR